MDFGRVFLGQVATKTVVLDAVGERPVAYTSNFRGDPLGYIFGPANFTIRAGGSQEAVVTFAPEVEGERLASVFIESNATDGSTVTITLRALGVAPPDCEDGNGCTIDTFDPISGRCNHEAARIPCDDFNRCTINDTCVEGVCLGESLDCSDDDSCTDDLCDPQQGCLNVPTEQCNDGDPCTVDICRETGGCSNERVPDGTPCNDAIACTVADICLQGVCLGVEAPEGTGCDDGDPCSLNDQCIQGECLDPDYPMPLLGDVMFKTPVGTPSAEASESLLVQGAGDVFAGIAEGVASVDRCGNFNWANTELAGARVSAAVALPGVLSIPVGAQMVDVETSSGAEIRRLSLENLFEPAKTSSTATVTVRIHDMALRSSGAIIASMVREIVQDGLQTQEGLLAEIDRLHINATVFRNLGDRVADRVAIDRDESVIVLLVDDLRGPGGHRIVRFGLDGLPEGTWSSTEIPALRSDLSLQGDGRILWSAGLLALTRTGAAVPLIQPNNDPIGVDQGAVVEGPDVLYMVVPKGQSTANPGILPGSVYSLMALDPTTGEERWAVELAGGALRATPVVAATGTVFVLTQDGFVRGYSAAGDSVFETDTELSGEADASLTITPDGVIVGTLQGHIFGLRWQGGLATTSWPRHRSDNFASGHP